MATETTQRVYLGDDNTFDLGFTVNGAPRTEGISRITTKLYETNDLLATPITFDTDITAHQEYFDYSNINRIVFAFGHATELQTKAGKTYYMETRLYSLDGDKVRVSSVKSDSDLPTITIRVYGVS